MSLLYGATKWLDHVVQYPLRRKITNNSDGTSDIVRAEGTVIQQGTARNAANYNNMEDGILQNNIYSIVLEQEMLQHQRVIEDCTGEFGTITITNSNKYPFESTPVTVTISDKRTNLNDIVQTEVVESVGNVERIRVFDKQLNGFKLSFFGSATSAQIKYKIVGGKY